MTTWRPLGTGIGSAGGVAAAVVVQDLLVRDAGNGPVLYGACDGTASGCPLQRWDGAAWTPALAGPPPTGLVTALRALDSGSGPALHVAFGPAGNGPSVVGRIQGSTFILLGTATSVFGAADISGLAVFDAGGGPRLYVAGGFSAIDGVPAASIASFNPGQGWSAVGNGAVAAFLDLEVLPTAAGPVLAAGGRMTTAGGLSATGAAAYGPSAPALLGSPAPRWAHAGRPVTLRGRAAATEPMSLQWRKDGAPVPGATQESLTLTAPTTADSGDYDLVATNACGPRVSAPARLTVAAAVLWLGADHGRGSARVTITSNTPAALALSVFSLDPANGTAPGLGPLAGLHIPLPEAVAQVFTGNPPFFMTLDTSGGAGFILAPHQIPPAFRGMTLWGVTHVATMPQLALAGVSPVARLTLE